MSQPSNLEEPIDQVKLTKYEQLEKDCSEKIKKAKDELDHFTKNDQSYRRKDTVEVVLDVMKRVKDAASEINKQSEETREKLYYLIYNATIIIFNACHKLRKSNFSREATHFLAFNVLCLDNNLILTTVKYLDWRVLNYVELARAYADFGALKAASKVITYAVNKVLYTKQVEEQDPPVPEGTKDTLIDALRVLRTQELKYELQAGILAPDGWKKKLEETFANNKYHRSLAIVESLQTNKPFTTSASVKDGNNTKASALKLVVELLKPDVELVKQALIQVHEKKKRDREKKEKLQNRDPDVDLDELLDKYKQMDAEMIQEKDWKFAASNVPIEIHVELVKLCYECQLWAEYELLLDPALVRLKFRRYEVAYLATIDVLMSANKVANIPNGFEKLPKDLNQANLRIELKRLRASSKATTGAAGSEDEPKKEEAKKAAAAPPKIDPKTKKPIAAAAPTDDVKPPTDEIQASENELQVIKHVYVHMLLQRTKNPQNAIVGVDVVLADENLGPELPDNHFAVAVPIRQHAGSYEKQGLIPYVVFRRTANSLIDEEDSLSIVTDVCVIQGQDPHLRAPLGYEKIPVDLRQTPRELERVPNLDYVFVCIKTDKQLALAERDLLILRRLTELEKSFIGDNQEQIKKMDETKQFLTVNYNQDLLVDLSSTVKEALLGPLGDYYLEHRLDMLGEMGGLLWQKYLLPVLQKIDIYIEMRGQKEYSGEFVDTMDEAVLRVRQDFVDTLNIMHRILSRMEFVEDMVAYCKCSIYLANLQENIGEFRNGVQALRAALGKVIEYREERMKRSLDSGAQENATTAMSITIDNKKIGDLEQKMETIYQTWEELILRKERDRIRKETGETPLEVDEGDEEQLEFKASKEELRDKDLFERGIDVAEWRRDHRGRTSLEGKKFFGETDQIIHALHVDILMNLYRCEVKLGKEMTVVKRQTQDLLVTQGIDLAKNAPGNLTKNLSGKLTQKMNLSKGKTLSQNKGALKNLQQTLQEAGKLPPAKPQILSYEKILERENNQNPYQNALLYMALAVAKSNNVEQKSLLLESLEFLKKARQGEDTLSNLALDNAVYIRAARHYHEYFGRSPDQVHPLSLLAKPQYIKKTPVPAKPVMVCRTSTSITMKLPFYKPLTEYKAWRNIEQVALYGKPSGFAINHIKLNDTDYEGTGEKRAPGAVVNVTGLIPNERYVFAAGGYTPEGVCVNGIGEVSNEILTLLPLSLHQLYGYLAEIAFKLGHYQIAKQAAELLCQQFITKNEFKYAHLDTIANPILAYRLDKDYLQRISKVEAKQLAEAFIILARVSKLIRGDVQRRADHCELQVEKQKVDMKIANFLCLSLEISTYLNRPSLTKRVVAELFNHLTPYFTMKLRPHILLQVLLKCHQSLKLVPQELIDANCRRILGCLSYQVVKLGYENAEDQMLRRAMISELPITSRKWRKYAQYVVQKPQLSEEEKEKQEEQQKRIELGEEVPAEELIKDPEPYEERLVKLDEFEDEGHALEEFLLSLMDYQDVVKAKAEKWKEQIASLESVISDGEKQAEVLKAYVAAKVDFWEQIKLNKPSAQLTAIIQAHSQGNENPRYLEFCCKCIRRAMETDDYESLQQLGNRVRDEVKISEEDEAAIETRINERLEYLDKDVVRKQRKRFAALEEKVKQILEEQSLTGGNASLGPRKLQQLVSGDKASGEDEGDQHVVVFQSTQQETQKRYVYLWVSEKYFLQGMCLFLELVSSSSQRSQLNVATQSCVFNDILQIDFVKYKQTLEEYRDHQKLLKTSFEEEHKDDEEKYVLQPEDRVLRVTEQLKVMARAAEYAKNSRSWLQLVSIIRYTWNVFSYDLTNPLELTQTDGWHYILLIAECSLYLVEHLQKGGSLRQMAGRDIDSAPNQQPSFDKESATKTVAFKFEQGTEGVDGLAQTEGPTAEAKKAEVSAVRWFEKIEEFEISIHASLIGFTVQCLMAVSKWESLVDISNRLNSATGNEFASQLLPFIIYAQSTLHGEAARSTSDKRKALEVRIQQFENWKLTSKKKRSRTAMLTGEIPPEEQEFNRDKQQLEKEIFRLDVIENVLLSDKQSSEGLLENIKRDANNCVESLKQCRKLYYQYGIETQNLQTEELKKGKNHFEIRSKRKGHKVFTTMVISNYKKCVELLRKRQEKFLLIQALHELGNLLYADGNLVEAEICWNDCVDAIFQRLYVVNQFRQVFADNASLADAFGSQQVLIGGIVLTKLAKLCYEGQDLHKHSECIIMAAELFAAPAKLSLPHPQVAAEYATYTFREFMGHGLFEDQYVLQPSELIHTLSTSCQALIDFGLFHKALPLAALMEYISGEVTRSKVLTVKARLLKAVALVELGYINQALQIYKRILSLKDFPDYAARHSEHSSRQKGMNYQFPKEQGYRNDLPPEADENQAVLKLLLESIPETTEHSLMAFCSPYILESLHFLRALFLVRIGETENVVNQEKAESRLSLLKTAEEIMRGSMRRLQFAEEIAHLKAELTGFKMREVDKKEDKVVQLTSQLAQAFERAATTPEARQGFYSNTEEEMCYADQRSQRLALILRLRSTLGRMYQSQGLLLESFYVLRQGLINFKALAEGQYREVEKGTEPDIKGSFKLPDALGGGAPAAAKGKGAPPPKDAKGGKAAPTDDQETKRLEEERQKLATAEAGALRAVVEAQEKRTHPHMGLWLSTKVAIIGVLLSQKRYEDCADAIAITRLEAQTVKDQLYVRKLKEIEFLIHVQSGDLKEAQLIAKEIRKHADKHHQTDASYCDFLGNLSELHYNQSKSGEAREIVEIARKLTWQRLGQYGVEVELQDINGLGDVSVWADRKKANEEDLEGLVPAAAAAAGGKGAPGSAAKGAAKPPPAKGQVAEEAEATTETSSLDFSKPLDYKLGAADAIANSSRAPPNIYIQGLQASIRFDLRYAQYLTLLEQQHETAKRVLQDTAKISARTLYVSPQLKFYLAFLLGHVNRMIFYEKVLQFQSQYMKSPKYKDSFASHVPYGSIALGHFLLELPNFSERIKSEYRSFLDWSEKAYGEAIMIAKQEAVYYEFDFSCTDALRGMAEVCFLQSEYRERNLAYKYADFNAKDAVRRLERYRIQKKELAAAAGDDDELDDGLLGKELAEQGDKWEEQKEDKEVLTVFNYRMRATKYLEAAVSASVCQVDFYDRQHELGLAALADPSKVPREVISELFEASQVSKVATSKQPDYLFVDKTSISASEVLAYTKAVANECSMLTFGGEKARLSKLLSKLHRFLTANLTSYAQRCVLQVAEPEPLKDAKESAAKELLPRGHVLCHWFDFEGQKSSLFYVLGPLAEEATRGIDAGPEGVPVEEYTDEQREQVGEAKRDNALVHFGKVEVDALVLSQLYQDTRDLIDQMVASEKLSAEMNERDRKTYRKTYHSLIQRLGNIFKPTITSEEELERDVDCLALVQDLIPELSVAGVESLAELVQKGTGCTWTKPMMSAIMRRIHRVRYVR